MLTGVKIIIVDDNANSRKILQRQVSSWGMVAKTAPSAEDALVIMRGEPFQVALLDMMMPEVDGIDLARQIKADPALAKTAVIFASSVGSRSEFSTRLVGLEVGAWLMKPVPESLLYDALVKVLAAAPEVTSPKADVAPKEPSAASKFELPGGTQAQSAAR